MKRQNINKEVVDITTEGIDAEIKTYLALGPDLCETPRIIPYEKIICETEKMCSTIRHRAEQEELDPVTTEREIVQLRQKSIYRFVK